MASKASGSKKSNRLRDRLSMIIYEGKAPPRYFEINKKLLRFVLVTLPLITVVSLAVVITGGLYFKQLRDIAKRKEPQIIKNLNQEIASLKAGQQELQNLNTELQNKLAEDINYESEKLETLSLFRPIPGMKNLTASPPLSIDETRLRSQNGTLNLSFDLINQSPDGDLITGFFFVLMKTPDALHIYPDNAFDEKSFQIPFNQGESFATQRFRPVENLAFPEPEAINNLIFKIVIFTRSGDLLIKKILSFDKKKL